MITDYIKYHLGHVLPLWWGRGASNHLRSIIRLARTKLQVGREDMQEVEKSLLFCAVHDKNDYWETNKLSVQSNVADYNTQGGGVLLFLFHLHLKYKVVIQPLLCFLAFHYSWHTLYIIIKTSQNHQRSHSLLCNLPQHSLTLLKYIFPFSRIN